MRIRSMGLAALLIPCLISMSPSREMFRSLQTPPANTDTKAQTKSGQTSNSSIVVPLTQPPIEMVSTEPNSWGIHISTSGGYDGRGKGALSLNWKGERFSTLMGSSCRANISRADVDSLFKAAVLADLFGVEQKRMSICFDCYITSLVIYRRNSTGIVRIRMFSWDQVSASQVVPAIQSLYNKAIALKDCQN